MAEEERQVGVDEEAPRVEAPAGAQILEFKRPEGATAVDEEAEETYIAIAKAAKLDQRETEVFLETAIQTAQVERALAKAYERTTDERRAAIVSVLLATGLNENEQLATEAFKELQTFARGDNNVIDLAQVATNPEETITQGIAGAAERVRSMGDQELQDINTKLPKLAELLDKLGIDGYALMTHIIASPEQGAQEVATILTSAMAPGREFTTTTTITGINPRTVELMAPWRTMEKAAQSFSTQNAPRKAA